jgi:hypothetical protein
METMGDYTEEIDAAVKGVKEAFIQDHTGDRSTSSITCVVHPCGTEEYKEKGGGTLFWLGKPEVKIDHERITIVISVTGPTKLRTGDKTGKTLEEEG